MFACRLSIASAEMRANLEQRQPATFLINGLLAFVRQYIAHNAAGAAADAQTAHRQEVVSTLHTIIALCSVRIDDLQRFKHDAVYWRDSDTSHTLQMVQREETLLKQQLCECWALSISAQFTGHASSAADGGLLWDGWRAAYKRLTGGGGCGASASSSSSTPQPAVVEFALEETLQTDIEQQSYFFELLARIKAEVDTQALRPEVLPSVRGEHGGQDGGGFCVELDDVLVESGLDDRTPSDARSAEKVFANRIRMLLTSYILQPAAGAGLSTRFGATTTTADMEAE
jgi:hypothetical protein